MFTKDLSPDSKVWVYQSSRKFTNQEEEAILPLIKKFVADWTAHKLQVEGEGLLLYNRFVVLAADEKNVGVSGCSIDSSVHFIRSLQTAFHTNFFDRWNIAYENGEEVESCGRTEFENLVSAGTIQDETIVFNNLVATKAEFDSRWKIAYKNSWLKNLAATHTAFTSVL